MTFVKWWEETFGYGDYGNPPNEAIDAWNAAWEAATLAERERAATVAEETPFTMSMFLRKEECKAAVNAQKVIAHAIRKGEGV